jgi:hypothetical protein
MAIGHWLWAMDIDHWLWLLAIDIYTKKCGYGYNALAMVIGYWLWAIGYLAF